MNHKIYWVWLQHALRAGSGKVSPILSRFDTVKNFYEAGKREWRLAGQLTAKELEALSSYSLEEAEAFISYCEFSGQQVITPDDQSYPEALRQIYRMPCALFVKGNLPDVDQGLALAVVGTRDATETGMRIAFEFGYRLAKQGVTIVSGGAKGIDTAAHKGALHAGGKTICVLGCGIGYDYLKENAGLREEIAQSGALVSEYPVDTPAYRGNFPVRNRLISGLCAGTLVVEAASKSGSLITAQTALEQNRDVFAVPCGIHNPVSQGANNLIKCGAKAATCPEDILEEYHSRFPDILQRGSEKVPLSGRGQEKPPQPEKTHKRVCLEGDYSPEAQKVFLCLTEEPQALLCLEEETGLSTSRLLTALTELELGGKIISYSGRRYGLLKKECKLY